MFHMLIKSPWMERTGWVLVHSLWQFALVALLATFLQWTLRRRSAAARYAVLLASMSFIVAVPIASWFAIGPIERPVRAGNPASAGLSEPNSSRPSLRDGAQAEVQRADLPPPPETRDAIPVAVNDDIVKPQAVPVAHGPVQRRIADWWSSLTTRLEPWLPGIVLIWFAGVGLFALRPLASWYIVRRLRTNGVSPVADSARDLLTRTARRLRLAQTVVVLQSTLVKAPVVVGYLRPLVLLPACVITGLPESQLELILAHELAHIRRHDYLVNLLQTLVETLFFYHPAIWWLSHRIRHERENCCDDIALSLTANRADYGRALLAIEELRAASPTLSVAASGGSLVARIRRIAGYQQTSRASGSIVFALLVVSVIILALAMWGSAPAAEKAKDGDEHGNASAAGRESQAEPQESPATLDSPVTLDSILKHLADEENRYESIEITATTTYRHINKEIFKGVIRWEESRERSVVAGSRLFYERADDYKDDEDAKSALVVRQAFDGLWSRQCGQSTRNYTAGKTTTPAGPPAPTTGVTLSAEPVKEAWASIGLDRKDEIHLLRGHTLLLHSGFGVKGRLLSAYLGSGWEDTSEHYAMTVEYLGDEQIEGLACHKLKCAAPLAGKVQLYALLWLARDRNLLPVRREMYENRISMTLPEGLQRVTKFREIRPGQWFPMEASDIAYNKDALRKGQVTVQWQRDVRIDKVMLAPPVDEKLFSSVDAPEGTLIAVNDRSGKRLGNFKQPHTGNIEISLDRFHAMQRAAQANVEDEYDPNDATAPKRKERIDAAFAVLRADPPLAQKERIDAAMTILQNFGVFQTNTKKWATAIRELITIGKPAVPRLIDELDHIDRAARPETELRALGFVLRGIGDPRAVPALIRALPNTLQRPASDCGCTVDDPELMAFMRPHDNENGSNADRFSFGRPINEILPALQKLTGIVAILPTEDGGKEFGGIRHTFRGGNANEVREQRKLFLRFTERWAGWWTKNWKQYVSDENDAQLDQTRAVLDQIAKELAGDQNDGTKEPTDKQN
jgi:beta-lactamase regulating signal transducer with metallopeptidase domain